MDTQWDSRRLAHMPTAFTKPRLFLRPPANRGRVFRRNHSVRNSGTDLGIGDGPAAGNWLAFRSGGSQVVWTLGGSRIATALSCRQRVLVTRLDSRLNPEAHATLARKRLETNYDNGVFQRISGHPGDFLVGGRKMLAKSATAVRLGLVVVPLGLVACRGRGLERLKSPQRNGYRCLSGHTIKRLYCRWPLRLFSPLWAARAPIGCLAGVIGN